MTRLAWLRQGGLLGLVALAGCPAEETNADTTTDPTLNPPVTTATTTGDGTTGTAGDTEEPPPMTTNVTTDPGTSSGGADSSSGGPPAVCGNGVAEGEEKCDGDDLGGWDCLQQGFEGGDLICADDCDGFDTTQCFFFICGNETIQGDEVCDGPNTGTETCQTQGFESGTLGCAVDCNSYDTSTCGNCGDGVVNGDENCEGMDLAGSDCEMEGFEGGTLACAVDCTYDTSDCSMCGDGVVSGFEACDGVDLGGQTCASLGFDMGVLGCAMATCAYDFSGCSGGQYVQDFEALGPMMPPEFALSGTANWFSQNVDVLAGSYTAASGNISHNQFSTMELNVNFAIPGTVEFTHEESTEGSFDYLEFRIDGVLIQEWSGINAPATFMTAVAAGTHTVEWSYTKDGSVDSGQDTVWVDDITIVGGVPI